MSDGSLDAESLRRFDEEGYLVFPGFLAPDHTSQLIADMGQLPLLGEGPSRGSGPMACLGFGLDGLGGLPTHPPTLALVSSVMGGRRYAMRHINAHLQSEGEAGNTWQCAPAPTSYADPTMPERAAGARSHDYPCGPPSDPYTTDHGLLNLDRKMCHTLYYPDGISGEIGGASAFALQWPLGTRADADPRQPAQTCSSCRAATRSCSPRTTSSPLSFPTRPICPVPLPSTRCRVEA